MTDRTMTREEAVERITDLLGYRSPLRVDIFRLYDDTLECRLVVDPDIAFAAMRASGGLASEGPGKGPDHG